MDDKLLSPLAQTAGYARSEESGLQENSYSKYSCRPDEIDARFGLAPGAAAGSQSDIMGRMLCRETFLLPPAKALPLSARWIGDKSRYSGLRRKNWVLARSEYVLAVDDEPFDRKVSYIIQSKLRGGREAKRSAEKTE